MKMETLRFSTLPEIPQRSYTNIINYSKQLEEFINKYKTRPHDIKFWPYGPYWPQYFENEILPTPKHITDVPQHWEPFLKKADDQNLPTIDNQLTPYMSKWRGVLIVFDSERSSRDHFPNPVPEGCCPSLLFESRFECGNLRQARRVGQFEYELVLKTDLYTNRHTQWYYFRVQNFVPGVTYKFRIVNLLKRDSLYNYGMRPLEYSESDAQNKSIGWFRTGHHVSYSRNVMHMHCPLLTRGIAYYELEWQMEFQNENDTCYLAHCYPYTFTDLKDDLESLLNDSERQGVIQREVLCETRAGNSCFLVTVTNFDQPEEEQEKKKAVVVTARVHPGESQASWMMKGVLDYITGPSLEAQELRNRFLFKFVPMLNPDGVIVGNYRCSLAARDLNRNYRRPRKESFPTVWHTKNMIDNLLENKEILLYCDLHGHSRKHNVFMYGNNTATDDPDVQNGVVGARAFLNERLFPWLMAQKCPEKFSFPFCKFNIKRCKEATGRVVMWRQMRILNSFTLEATFSGTAINKDECRHFNIGDFLEMGQVLCHSVLEYQLTQENKARQTEIVLEMTRYLTCQVLERRNLVNGRMPNLRALIRSEQTSAQPTSPTGGELDNLDDIDDDSAEISDGGDANMESSSDNLRQEHRIRRQARKRSMEIHADLSKSEVDQMLDSASMKTMDGCLKILAQLNVSEALEESDSSDSDSESEPELKPVEPKPKKKKRKSKKQRDKEQQDRKGGSGGSDKKEERAKVASALPTINGTSSAEQRHEGYATQPRSSQGVNGERYLKSQSKKEQPHFVSKYSGRKNGGIPCFAEERSIERAAKRMAEMRKRTEEEKQREMAFFSYSGMIDFEENLRFPQLSQEKCVEDGSCQCPRAGMPLLRRSLTHDDLQRRLQVALNEGTPNIAQTLVGFNVRTGYTHADSFRDLAPSVHPAQAPQNNSSSSDTETEGEMPSLSMSTRNNPYHHGHDHMANHTNNSANFHRKHLSLRGPTMKPAHRHMTSSATPPYYGNPSSMLRADMLPSPQGHYDDRRRYDDRRMDDRRGDERPRRDSRNQGPLTLFGEEATPKIRGLRVPGHGE